MHNTRIERLWRDYNLGVMQKWKSFFVDLEENDNLDPNNLAHIWLLHWLFLDAINADLMAWVHTWNNHKLSQVGQQDRSPRDMYIFGLLEDGPRGMDFSVLAEMAECGIGRDLIGNQADDWNQEAGEVVIPQELKQLLEERLREVHGINFASQNMAIRCLVWQTSFLFFQEIAADLGLAFR